MIRLIIEKELRDIIGTTKFAVTFAVGSLLILFGFYVGAKDYQGAVAQYEAAKTEDLRQMDGLTDWLSLRNHRIFLPPQPLASLVSGVSNDIGSTTEVQGRGELSATDSRYGDNPVFAMFRFLDLDFIFQIVLSLFAILFAYDAVNGEKERGTLRLTFANALPRGTYILGKMSGSYLALAVPLLIPILLGCALLPVMGVSLHADEWLRLAVIVLAGLLYLGVFVSLSVLLSALTQRSSTSFLMLLVIWIFVVLIIPRVSVLVAGRAVDVPSIDEIAYKTSRLNAQLWSEDRKKMSGFKPSTTVSMDSMLSEFNKFMQGLADERDKKMRELTAQLNQDRSNRERQQEALAFGLARTSPAGSFSLAASALAGTSIDLKDRYHEAAMNYQQAYAKFMFAKTGMNVGGRMIMIRSRQDGGEPPKPIDPRELPTFEFPELTLATAIGKSIVDLGTLFLGSVLLFAGAFAAFLRYDVR